jgi:hypothetical protein
MNWKALAFRVLVPLVILSIARYCAGSAVQAERFIKTMIPDQKLPDSVADFGSAYLEQLYRTLGDKGLEVYQQFILYRLPSQILILSIIYPLLRDIAQYLGKCEMRLDIFTKKRTSRFYPTAHLQALSWPFLFADSLQTIILLLSLHAFKKQELLFSYLATFAGKLASLKNLSLIVLLNGLPVGIIVSLSRILIVGWHTGNVFRGFKDSIRLERLNKQAN